MNKYKRVQPLHYRQRFYVQRFDDYETDGEDADLYVKWSHHGGEERTWEPLQQLIEDVPVLVENYVNQAGDQVLQRVFELTQVTLTKQTGMGRCIGIGSTCVDNPKPYSIEQ